MGDTIHKSYLKGKCHSELVEAYQVLGYFQRQIDLVVTENIEKWSFSSPWWCFSIQLAKLDSTKKEKKGLHFYPHVSLLLLFSLPLPSTHQHLHLHYFVDKDLTDANRQQKSALPCFKIILYHVPNPPTISPSCLVKNMLRYQPEMHLNLPWKLWLVNFTF